MQPLGEQSVADGQLPMSPQTDAGSEDDQLEQLLNSPLVRENLKRENIDRNLTAAQQFLLKPPQEYFAERVAQDKPNRGKLGKIGNVLGEVLAGLGRAPESPNMRTERLNRDRYQKEYDDYQQNVRSVLEMSSLQDRSLSNADKLQLSENKTKIDALLRKKGIDQKTTQQDLQQQWRMKSLDLQNRKASLAEKSQTALENFRNQMLVLRREGNYSKTFEQLVTEQVKSPKNPQGTLTLQEASKIIADNKAKSRPVRGLQPSYKTDAEGNVISATVPGLVPKAKDEDTNQPGGLKIK